ncbi:MAG TPA: hypothetical protein PK228_15120 [Saprospiraceae bacterium]|nr:hypothetical protein [Saprospiraceae bacterium]
MKYFLIFWMFLAVIPLNAQKEEVVFDKATVHGGFGGPFFELTSMDGQTGVLAGGSGGVIVNNFFFGGFGQGGSFAEHTIAGHLYPIDMGFGGFWMGYVTPTYKAIHFYSSLKIAGGGVSLSFDDNNDNALYDEAIFVVQPEAGIELNLIKWFRIALTGNYRIVSGIQTDQLAGLSNSDFNAAGMTLTLRFGKFYRGNGQ